MNPTIRACSLFHRFHQCVLSHNVRAVVTYPFQKMPIVRQCHTSPKGVTNVDFDIKELTNGDQTLEKKLKILFLEVDIWRQEGERIPSQLKPEEWKELISLGARSARKKYLLFCWKKEIKKTNDKKKKDEKKLKRIENVDMKTTSVDPTHYGLGGNSMFMRIRDTTMMNFFNGKLIEAMQFSQELVVDCGYDKYMTRREVKNCGKQLMLLFSENRMHINPFNLYFCNARRESWSMQEFEKIVKTAFEPHFPLNITEKSYLELFPKERIIYLTPHCREELINYDHNAVYIIGGLVDKVNNEPLSLARAKEQGLKMARLPLEKFLAWGPGSGKSLTLNQMMMILLDLRLTGDWKKALKHVPPRKIEKVYQVDYSSDRFKLTSSGGRQTKSKDVYKQLTLNRIEKQQ